LQSPGLIADIAGRLGFADEAPLFRLFKRVFGVTSATYRRLA
jgi:AraC-like DNA-binding protein